MREGLEVSSKLVLIHTNTNANTNKLTLSKCSLCILGKSLFFKSDLCFANIFFQSRFAFAFS